MIKVITEKSIVSTNEWCIEKVKSEASKYDSVLDIGCGAGELINSINADKRLGIDICDAAISKAQQLRTRKKYRIQPVQYLVGDIMCITSIVKKRIDCIIGIDVIEHFNKYNASNLILQCEAKAKKKLIFFVPVGVHPQTKDSKGFGNDYYQTHRSSWYPEEMEERGYEVFYYPDWHKNILPPKEKGAMFCIKTLA
jgi:cyclopropane fatty-acyl-phospholipid synthase-like methyltransferase